MNILWMIPVFLVLALVIPIAYAVIMTYRLYWNGRAVTCPETHEDATIRIDAGYAARTYLVGRPDLRLKGCSLWPKPEGCGEQCLKQVQLRA